MGDTEELPGLLRQWRACSACFELFKQGNGPLPLRCSNLLFGFRIDPVGTHRGGLVSRSAGATGGQEGDGRQQ